MNGKFKWIAMVVCVVSSAGPLWAQDAYLAQIYGDGVHRYFRHDAYAAKRQFDAAINHGSRDPRAYYFRAIIAIEQGDSAAAQSDVQQGARYELEGRGTYDVWRALDRVQGPQRLQFEGLRSEALLALRRQSVIDRYPLVPDEPGEYLRPPADPRRTPLEPDVPSRPFADPTDPFADDGPPPAPPADDLSDDDMLQDDDLGLDEIDPLQPDDRPAEIEDPFGDDEMTAPEDSVGQPAADAGDDPFADDAAGDDPFADDAGDDDPFADDSSPMDSAPAENADDPFGGDDVSGEDDGAQGGDAVPPSNDDDPFGDAVNQDDPFGDIFE